MNDGNEPRACDNCDRQTACSNIYVAMRITESELQHCRNQELARRFKELVHEISLAGYRYPHSSVNCSLVKNSERTEELLNELQALLDQIRSDIKGLSPYVKSVV